MSIRRFYLNDDYIRLGFISFSLVITYLFIITPLKLNHTGYYFFQDSLARYAYKFFYEREKNTHITIVVLDDESLRSINLKWPWPRSRFAELIDKINSCKPKTIAFDISFVGKGSYGEQDDAVLAESIRKSNNIILASHIDEDGVSVLPAEEIANAACGVGFVNKIKDRSFIVRDALAVGIMEGKNRIDYSFEVEAASLYYGMPLSDLKLLGNQLILKGHRMILNLDGTFPIKYTKRLYNFNTISVSDIFNGNFDPLRIKDKLVMVGQTAEISHDSHLTPLGFMPGVVIDANTADNIISKNLLKKPPALLMFLFLFLLSIAAVYAGLRYQIILSVIITGLMIAILYALSIFAFLADVELDFFGFFVLLCMCLSITRFYIYVKSYIEKSKMLNILTVDEYTGLYNIYFLHIKLQHLLDAAKNKRESPTLILLEFKCKNKAPLLIDDSANKELIINIASIVKAIVKHLNGIVARAANTELGIVFPTSDKRHLDQAMDSIYSRLDNLEIVLPGGKVRLNIDVSMGICQGSDLDEKSARLMVYAAQEALIKARCVTGKRIFIFDVTKESIGSFKEEKTLHTTESRLIDFVIGDLKNENKHLRGRTEELNLHLTNLKNSYMTVISSLVKALEEKDVYTAGHSERVTRYSLALADKFDLSDSFKETLKKAAMLHDIGKIGIPDAVLHKKETLSADERSIIQRHQLDSVRILEPATFLRDTIPLILHHHERYDGSGYPHGLVGDRIPLGARLITISDAFDAMTSGRGYNNPMSTDEAILVIKANSGKQFDPELVDKFLEVVKESSTGG